MRLPQFLALATFGLLAAHCSADEPEADPAEVIESRPGSLVITSPERAAFIEGEKGVVVVKGSGATSALTINGKSAKVSADGTFEVKVSPTVGLNLVVAVDGESRLETPFLYGHFAPANQAVPKAVALEVGPAGIQASLPTASLASVTTLALKDRDLIGMLRGKTLSGKAAGANYSFKVTGGRHDNPDVSLNPAAKGLGITAQVTNVIVEGDLTIEALGLDYTRPVRISVDRATVLAESELGVDEQKGSLRVVVPSTEAYLDGFRYSSDNAGFPCCVDSIITSVLRPKVQEAIATGIREQVPSALALTLDGVGLPKDIDFSAAGVRLALGVETKLDAVSFDPNGGTVTASTLFDGRFTSSSPGSKAPGWLTFGRPFEIVASKRASSFGVSLSVDAVNQLMFAAWGSGTLSYTAPAPFNAKLTPALPPVVALTDAGVLRLGLGEVRVQRGESNSPLAAATILQDVDAKADGAFVILEPSGQPTISITWLSDEMEGSGRNLVALAAKEQLDKFLKPFRIPVPKIALDKLGGGFAGQSLAIESSKISLDREAARLGVAGAMKIVK